MCCWGVGVPEVLFFLPRVSLVIGKLTVSVLLIKGFSKIEVALLLSPFKFSYYLALPRV